MKTAALLALLAPIAANAWSTMLYSGLSRNQDTSFTDVEYSGSDNSGGCVVVGDPGNNDNCIWHTDNGNTSAPCTAPMVPEPLSFMFDNNGEANTECWVGWESDCDKAFAGKQIVPDKCYIISEIPMLNPGDHAPLSFNCKGK